MKRLHLLFALIMIMASCVKEQSCDCPPVNVSSANVTMKIVDNNQQVISGASIDIFSAESSSQVIFNCITEESGICDAGKILEGQYGYIITKQVENRRYTVKEYFQVISGDDKTIEVNPYTNVGTAKIRIVDTQGEPIPYISVALIPHPNYSNVDDYFDDLLEEAYFIGIADAEGKVVFENVPAYSYYSHEYSITAYQSSTEWDYPTSNNSFYLGKNQTVNETIRINL